MKLSLAAAAVAVPCLVSAYSLGGPRRFRRSMVVMPPGFSSCAPSAELFRQKQQALTNRAFGISSPRYEIVDNEEQFKIAVDVPGVKASDIDVSIENDGAVLTLSGRREASGNQVYQYSSKFAQSFALDPATDVDKFTANLQNGVLIVSAPKDFQRIEESVKKVPVMQLDEESIPMEKSSDGRDEVMEEVEGPTAAPVDDVGEDRRIKDDEQDTSEDSSSADTPS